MGRKIDFKKPASKIEKSRNPGFGRSNVRSSDDDWRLIISQYKRKLPSNLSASKRTERLKKLIYKAKACLESMNYETAALSYCEAMALDPQNLDALRGLAMVDCANQRYESALDLTNRAIALNQRISSLWIVKLEAICGLKKYDLVEETVTNCLTNGCDPAAIVAGSQVMQSDPKLGDIALRLMRESLLNPGILITEIHLSLLPLAARNGCFDIFKCHNWLKLLRDLRVFHVVPSLAITILSLCTTEEDNKIAAELFSGYWAEAYLGESLPALNLSTAESRMNRCTPQQKIRIGFLGGDFRNHVVSIHLLPLVENLDLDRFEIFCISTSSIKDEYTVRYESVSKLVDVSEMTDYNAICNAVRQLKLDICIDVAGFTANNAAPAFAKRMAPIQMSMLGFPGSTFCPNIDYLIVDKHTKPMHPWMHSGDLLQIDGCSFCITEYQEDIELESELPQERHGFINYGIFVNPWKYSAQCVQVWAQILKRCPNSQISIVRPEVASSAFIKNILDEFAFHGIDSTRLLLANNHGKGRSHLYCYKQVDVVLDTFPMTGGTSTADALAMGLPVISLFGINYHQKISLSFLDYCGIGFCAVNSIDEYISLSVSLAQSKDLLRQIKRRAHEERTRVNGLFDGQSYARRFEKAMLRAIHNNLDAQA